MHAEKDRRRARPTLVEHAWWALGSLWLAVVLWAFLNGPRIHEMVEQEAAVEEEAENRNVCDRLRMPPGSPAYSVCASELGEVRQRQKHRLERQAMGLL